ncbi:MAG: hypothetical protein Q8P02_02860 [Candidatus Micrarchaeota archaeon]|nr:hypothetical protein [Candidatus Micrarchaeota archaeon]
MAVYANVDKYKVFSILDNVLAVLALLFGLGFMLSGLGLGARQFVEPFTSGILGILVGLVFLIYALRFFNVIR